MQKTSSKPETSHLPTTQAAAEAERIPEKRSLLKVCAEAFQAWNVPQSWEQVRAKGKWRFVVNCMLTGGLTGIVLGVIIELVFYRGIDFSRLLFMIVFCLLIGFLLAVTAWSEREARYKDGSWQDQNDERRL